MRKIVSYALSVAFLAAGLISCAKSTKGKVTNEWKVVSYLKTESNANQQSAFSHTSTLNMTENSLTMQHVSVDDGMTVTSNYTGTVNAFHLIISKDGTWSSNQDLTYDLGNGDEQRNVNEKSGTWSFVGKTKGDDFKKNERILFNVLTHKLTANQIHNQTVVNQISTLETFLTGENTEIYTIKESKKKEMEMELVNEVNITSGNGETNTDKLTVNMALKEK